MKASSFLKASTFVVAALFALSASTADATIADEAKCRATIAKNVGKLHGTAAKAIGGCIKAVLGAKLTLASGERCTIANADTKGKVAGTSVKFLDAVGGVKTKCLEVDHPISLAGYGSSCQVGVNGAPQAIADYGDVGTCLVSASIGAAELALGEVVTPDYTAIAADPASAKDVAKCANAIAKGAIKALGTYAKERSKAQNGVEKTSVAVTASYGQYNVANAKIDGAVQKFKDGVAKSCAALTTEQLITVGSCASSVAGIQTCAAEAIESAGEGLISMAYLNSGNLPSGAVVRVLSGTTSSGATALGLGSGNGFRNRTTLNAGWTGLGHKADVVDDFQGQVDFTCGGDGICDVSASCDQNNCRCSNDVLTLCDEPFVADADDCGGNVCTVFFGPPLPLSASGVPTCVVNTIDDIDGSLDLSNGANATLVENRARVFTGASQEEPCPRCDGDPTANDGIRGGTCSGGVRSGLNCDANGIDATFGATSYDCQPTLATNVTGGGLELDLNVGDTPADLTATVSCGGLLGAFDCHCKVCSGATTVACNTDAECASIAAGTCSANGSGTPTQPNGCSNDSFNCPASGLCAVDTASFCDGMVRASGKGIITCSNQGDCDALDPNCPGGDCGGCNLVEPVPCFNDTITISGVTNAGSNYGVLGANFCVPPTSSGSVNGAGGLPGPASTTLAFQFDVLCPDGVTEAVYGGINCP